MILYIQLVYMKHEEVTNCKCNFYKETVEKPSLGYLGRLPTPMGISFVIVCLAGALEQGLMKEVWVTRVDTRLALGLWTNDCGRRGGIPEAPRSSWDCRPEGQ